MSFFYDLNKRLAALAAKTEQQQIAESKKAEAVAQSPLTKALNESMTAEAGYSAKKARAGKDIGKPGKNFAKIAKGAAERYGSKEAGERVAGAVLNKLRHPKEGIENEGNAFTGALAKTPKGGKFKVGNKEFTDTSSIEETGGVPMTPKQKSFAKLAPPADKITFADKIAGAKKEVDEMLGDVAAKAIKGAIHGHQHEEEMDEGYAEMDAWLKKREAEKGTGKFDRKERTLPGGMKATTYTRKHDDDADDTEVSNEPKRRGRPAGPKKGPERVTKGAWKHKGERKVAEEEQEVCEHCGQPIVEKAKSKAQQKFMGMVHAAQKGEKPASKEVSKVAKEMPKKAAKDFASTKHKGLPGHVEEESTDKEDQKAEKAGKKVAKDIEHDEGHKGKDDNRAEKAGKKVTKDIEYDDKKDRKEKEEKVDETTVAGSVATATAAPNAGKGMQFGKGVYESLDRQFKQALTESISVESSMSECGDGMGQGITIQADGEEAEKLMALLKLAGLTESMCPTCGKAPCRCEELDENSPDWPTNTEKLDAEPNLRTYSGGLNGPKSTGQSTTVGGGIPNYQARRQTSMEESVELERSLFKTWKNYKG
jgi:hypothetical protein